MLSLPGLSGHFNTCFPCQRSVINDRTLCRVGELQQALRISTWKPIPKKSESPKGLDPSSFALWIKGQPHFAAPAEPGSDQAPCDPFEKIPSQNTPSFSIIPSKPHRALASHPQLHDRVRSASSCCSTIDKGRSGEADPEPARNGTEATVRGSRGTRWELQCRVGNSRSVLKQQG